MSNSNKTKTNAAQSDATQQTASADLGATGQGVQQQRVFIPAGSENTTTSGDAKGEAQSIGASDVGDLSGVLGDLGALSGTGEATKVEGEENLNTDALLNGALVGGATAPEAPKADPAAVTLAPRAPVAVQAAVVDASANVTRGPIPEADREVRAGVSVSTNEAPVVEGVPEVTEAYKVVNMQVSAALVQAEEYVVAMAPGKSQNQKSVEQNQLKLLNTLHVITGADETSFKPAFIALIALVRANRDKAFKTTLRHRGLHAATLGTIDNKSMRFLTRMVDLLVVTSGVKDLSSVKTHVDMKRVLESVQSVRAQQNLTGFYSS